jgi:lysophospholipase L1-like esterase
MSCGKHSVITLIGVFFVVLSVVSMAGCSSSGPTVNLSPSPAASAPVIKATVTSTKTESNAATVNSSSLHAHRIVCIGDSLTQGGYGNETDRWPYWLKARLDGDWEVINQGEGGYKTADVLAHVDSALALKPHFVLMMGGIMDLVNGAVPPATTQENIKAISARVESSGAIPVLCTVTPIGSNSTQRNTLNAWIIEYAHLKGYSLIDFNKVLENPLNPGYAYPALMTADGVHPTTEGYIAMGNAIDLAIFTGGR